MFPIVHGGGRTRPDSILVLKLEEQSLVSTEQYVTHALVVLEHSEQVENIEVFVQLFDTSFEVQMRLALSGRSQISATATRETTQ